MAISNSPQGLILAITAVFQLWCLHYLLPSLISASLNTGGRTVLLCLKKSNYSTTQVCNI
uniref:Uncharacterized protein n=1 Tax=Anguilla anguilla TaxID=7936 RepID=A0A0E9WRR0_ANGAN